MRIIREESWKEKELLKRRSCLKKERQTTSPIEEQTSITKTLSQELLKISLMTKLDLNKEDLKILDKFSKEKNSNKSIHSILKSILFPLKSLSKRTLSTTT
jgi:hypothetical protein